MRDGRPALLHFDLTADDEAVWGWGLGCNGVIDVFVEPVGSAAPTASAIRAAIDQQRPLASVTVIEAGDRSAATPGRRLLAHPDGKTEGSLGDRGLDERAKVEALRALRDERSGTVELSGGICEEGGVGGSCDTGGFCGGCCSCA